MQAGMWEAIALSKAEIDAKQIAAGRTYRPMGSSSMCTVLLDPLHQEGVDKDV